MHRANQHPIRQVVVALAVALAGAGAVILIVESALFRSAGESHDISAHYMLEQIPDEKARFQELWFGPGITDDLNRMVKIGLYITLFF